MRTMMELAADQSSGLEIARTTFMYIGAFVVVMVVYLGLASLLGRWISTPDVDEMPPARDEYWDYPETSEQTRDRYQRMPLSKGLSRVVNGEHFEFALEDGTYIQLAMIGWDYGQRTVVVTHSEIPLGGAR